MSFLYQSFLGVRIWIWAYLLFSWLFVVGWVIYWRREYIREKYYKIRFPEKVIKIVIHYKTGLFTEFWRLIPDLKYFIFNSKQYLYHDKKVIKENDFFIKGDKKLTATIDGKDYNLNEKLKIKGKKRKYPEIHYFYNNPNPIDFDFSDTKAELSSKELQQFKDNDLFLKLLTLSDTESKIMILMIICIGNLIVSLFLLAKVMGWIA